MLRITITENALHCASLPSGTTAGVIAGHANPQFKRILRKWGICLTAGKGDADRRVDRGAKEGA